MVAWHNLSTNPCPQILMVIHRAFTLPATFMDTHHSWRLLWLSWMI